MTIASLSPDTGFARNGASEQLRTLLGSVVVVPCLGDGDGSQERRLHTVALGSSRPIPSPSPHPPVGVSRRPVGWESIRTCPPAPVVATGAADPVGGCCGVAADCAGYAAGRRACPSGFHGSNQQGGVHARTIATTSARCRNRFSEKGPWTVMGMKPRLATVARQRGHIALLVFHDAAKDNVIDLSEQRAIRDHLEDWQSATEAADLAGGFAEAIGHGVGSADDRYLVALFDRYRVALDEVPLDAA